MAQTTATLACTKIALVRETYPNGRQTGQSYYDLLDNGDSGQRRLYLRFADVPANLRNYGIISAKVKGSLIENPGGMQWNSEISLYSALSDFNPATITWANAPVRLDRLSYKNRGTGELDIALEADIGTRTDSAAKALIGQTFLISADNRNSLLTSWARISASSPAIALEYVYDTAYQTESQVQVENSVTSGYLNPHVAQVFRWSMGFTGSSFSINAVLGYSQNSATFYWRAGTSGSYTAINISGSTMSVSIPANTFPSGTVQYYVSAVGSDGHTSTTPVYTISTADTLPVSTAISPAGSVEDGSAPITARWSVSNASGSAPTRIDLCYMRNGDAEYTYILNQPGSLRSYVFPAGTFLAGQNTWGVRAYNIDDSPGSWVTKQFIVIAAPAAPVVTTDGAPFATFNWQGDGQQAWRLTVDGKLYGPFFGTDRSYTLPDYLRDGNHTASVEIQGQYGLWSQPGTVSFTVANSGGDAVDLGASFGVDAELYWSTGASTADFLVYRDGVRIGHTANTGFVDRFVLGEHSWQVINRLPGGMYTASNIVTGLLRSCETVVAAFSGGDWIKLRLSENSASEQRFTFSRTQSLRHMRGAVYPVLELGPYEDGSGSYDTAFEDVPSAAAFETLRGKLVIIKSRGGNVVIGALTNLEKRAKHFFLAYTFTVQRCHWEDFVDDENG